MAWVATATGGIGPAFSSYLQSEKEEEQIEQAKDDAEEARLEAIRAEQFAEEEGKGQGQLGKISLALDDEIDEELNQKTTL
tara:strand:+ start:3095 stop:3337 length:243 start_codon:yes stop_codon:yes gene_type:complete